jgi:hypothetical protein
MRRPMGRTLRILLPCALGLVAALLVSCGDTSHLIPGTDADAINQNVDAAAAATGSGRCGRADAAVQRAEAHVQQLPSSVDPKLRANLEQGLARLRATAATECGQNKQETTTTETTESTASTESTESTESTASTETQSTETQPTQTQPTETQNTSTGGQDTSGGNGNGGSGGDNGNAQGNGGGSSGGTQAP